VDNLVDGVENFAAAHPLLWLGLVNIIMIVIVLVLLIAISRCVTFLIAHAPELLMRPVEVRDVLLAIALASLWQYGAHVKERWRLQDLQNDVRDLTHDLDRIAWKLDESACRGSP